MVQEGHPRGGGNITCRSLRIWSLGVIAILLLSACFALSCVGTDALAAVTVLTAFTMGRVRLRVCDSSRRLLQYGRRKCSVTSHLTREKSDKRLSEMHRYHSSLACFSEGTGEKEVWGCCPTMWKSFGSSCYFVSTEENVWSKSKQKCVEMGAHLVVINTEAEQNFIVQQLNKSVSYFLGLFDPQGNDSWQWIDQTPFKQNVRFWHLKEPNFSAEQCGSIVFWNERWGWNDVFCDTKRNSICEMKKIYL